MLLTNVPLNILAQRHEGTKMVIKFRNFLSEISPKTLRNLAKFTPRSMFSCRIYILHFLHQAITHNRVIVKFV
jgi:hypothetical protein